MKNTALRIYLCNVSVQNTFFAIFVIDIIISIIY